jgi:hypothetical protein
MMEYEIVGRRYGGAHLAVQEMCSKSEERKSECRWTGAIKSILQKYYEGIEWI